MKVEYTDMVLKLSAEAVDKANEFIEVKVDKMAPLIKALQDIEEGVKRRKRRFCRGCRRCNGKAC